VIARLASLITAALGVVTGVFVLFGPTSTRCSLGSIGQTGIGQPVQTLTPAHCDTMSLVQSQSVWPMPLLAIALWSLAPMLAVLGVWSGRPWLVAIALIVEMSSIISFGVGPYFLPYVAAPLALTWLLARRAATAASRTPV
jgi:hypothetical protein